MASVENEQPTAVPVVSHGKVRKPKIPTTPKCIHLTVPVNETSIVSKANMNRNSNLVCIKPPKTRGFLTMNVRVLLAAEQFIRDAARDASHGRESTRVVRLGDDVVRCVHMIEFTRNGDPRTRSYVDPEALARSVSYIELVDQTAEPSA